VTGWTKTERCWRDALLAAFIPANEAAGLPGLGDLDLAGFWVTVEQRAPALLRLGLRVSVWCLTFAPLLLIGSPRLFTGLDAERRDRMIDRAGRSRLYLVRQLVTTLKAVACLAYLRDPGVRSLVEAGQDQT